MTPEPRATSQAREMLADQFERISQELGYDCPAGFDAHNRALLIRAGLAEQPAVRAISKALPFDWQFRARFWSMVEVRSSSECWPWRGSLSNGYPCLRQEGKTRRAAQVAWEIANGSPFPTNHEGCHRCDNPPCCNPAHIFPGTHAENMKDMNDKARNAIIASRRLATHCSAGHEYTPDNTRVFVRDGSKRRQCRECSKRYNKKYRSPHAVKDGSDVQ